MYQYSAKLLNIVDGDTVDMDIDMGFNVRIKQRLRLRGINTAELKSKDLLERGLAIQAKEYIMNNMVIGDSYTINTYKDDKYGRLLADIFLTSGTLNSLLIKAGLAKAFMV